MPYLIDGHNLIPRVAGLSLASPDDEAQLIGLLQAFCREAGKRAEVYFDNAPAGHSGQKQYGPLTAHFVRQGSSADAALKARLRKLGRQGPNWTLVSSDREVQAAARQVGAQVVEADNFARQLQEAQSSPAEAAREDPSMSEREISEWLTLFGNSGEDEGL